jgi:sialic acid synthase SpsE
MRIGTRQIGRDCPTYVIAEIGVNHDGSLERALELVRACADAGAGAVKFQSFDPTDLVTERAPLADYQRRAGAGVSSQLEMLAPLALTVEQLARLAACCAELGVDFLSSPFDLENGRRLAELGVPAIKVASGELTNLQLLSGLAALGRPLLISTGMGTLEDIARAVEAVGDTPAALLHCVSSYPTPPEQANLRAIQTLQRLFPERVVGYSDHCLGIEVSLAAVALGASVLERHVTYDRAAAGPDHAISLLPGELAELIRRTRLVESALGSGEKKPQQAELNTMAVARRSLIATRRIQTGEQITAADVAAKRPANGLSPARLSELLGRPATRTIELDEPFTEADL